MSLFSLQVHKQLCKVHPRTAKYFTLHSPCFSLTGNPQLSQNCEFSNNMNFHTAAFNIFQAQIQIMVSFAFETYHCFRISIVLGASGIKPPN